MTRLEILVYEHHREEQLRFPDHVERGLNLQQGTVEFVLITSLLRQSWIVVLQCGYGEVQPILWATSAPHPYQPSDLPLFRPTMTHLHPQ